MRYGLTLGGTRRRASNASAAIQSRPELGDIPAIVFYSFLTELRDEPAFDGIDPPVAPNSPKAGYRSESAFQGKASRGSDRR